VLFRTKVDAVLPLAGPASLPALLLVLSLTVGLWAQNPLSDALGAGRFSEALQIADELLKTHPNDAKLLTARGLALDGIGRPQDALASFGLAIEAAPNFTPALKAASQTAYLHHDSRASDFLSRLLKVVRDDPTAHAMAGVLAFEAGDCAQSVDHFGRAGDEPARNELASSQFGQCLIKLGRAGDASAMFQALVALHPETTNGRYNLAVAQLLNGKAAEAIQTLQPLTSGEQPDPGVLNLLASAYVASRELDAAAGVLRRAIDLAPQQDVHYLDLATLYFQRDRFPPALEILNAGLRRVPDSARLLMMRGAVRAQMAEFEGASADFQAADKLDPERGYGSVGLGVLLNETNQLAQARDVLRQRLKSAPQDPMLNYLLADSLIREAVDPAAAEFEEARAALQRAIASRPAFAKAHAALAKLHSKAGRTENAIAELRVALQYDPAEKSALNQLFLLLRRTGREQEAQAVGERLRKQLSAPAVRVPSR